VVRKQHVVIAVLFFGTVGVLSVAAYASPVVPWPTVLSIQPLFSGEADVVFDPKLLGTWGGSLETFTFEQADKNSYHFTVTSREQGSDQPPAKSRYRAYLVKVGEYLFMDLFPIDLPPARHGHQTRGGHSWRVHSFMLVESIGERLSISPVNRPELFSNAADVEKVEQDDRLLLLCSTPKLRELLLDRARHARLYTGTFSYPHQTATEGKPRPATAGDLWRRPGDRPAAPQRRPRVRSFRPRFPFSKEHLT